MTLQGTRNYICFMQLFNWKSFWGDTNGASPFAGVDLYTGWGMGVATCLTLQPVLQAPTASNNLVFRQLSAITH